MLKNLLCLSLYYNLAFGALIVQDFRCTNEYQDVGTCMRSRDCSSERGLAIGNCTFMTGQTGTCCYHLSCQQRVRRQAVGPRKRLSSMLQSVCGLRFDAKTFESRQPQLLNGQEVAGDSHRYPWVLALWIQLHMTSTAFPTCGATLISNKHALTAGHCVASPAFRYILIGGSVINNLMTTGVVIDIKSILIHPKYNARNFENDIALITLAEVIVPSKQLFPICLPPPLPINKLVTDYSGIFAHVAGWGCDMEGCNFGQTPTVLEETTMPVIHNDVAMCWFLRQSLRPGTKEYIPSRLFVVGGDASGLTTTCSGDSGSSVVRKLRAPGLPNNRLGQIFARFNPERYEIIGIVSWSKGCGRKFRPSVWTRVETHVQWIRANMKF